MQCIRQRGSRHQAAEAAYWRDVGTIDASTCTANRDIPRPRTEIRCNPKWPISTSGYSGPSSTIIEGTLTNCVLGAGTLVNGARAVNSIIRREVVLEGGVEIEDSIIMDYTIVRQGAKLKRVIVDRFNTIDAGQRVGYDNEADRSRYHVTPSGIVVVARPACRRRHALQ